MVNDLKVTLWVIEERKGEGWVQRRVCARQALAVRFIERLRYQSADPHRYRLRPESKRLLQ